MTQSDIEGQFHIIKAQATFIVESLPDASRLESVVLERRRAVVSSLMRKALELTEKVKVAEYVLRDAATAVIHHTQGTEDSRERIYSLLPTLMSLIDEGESLTETLRSIQGLSQALAYDEDVSDALRVAQSTLDSLREARKDISLLDL